MTTRRHGVNRRDDSAPRAVNGRAVTPYSYSGTLLDAHPLPEDPVCAPDRTGTHAGWNLHQREKRHAAQAGLPEPPACKPCIDAHAEYVAEWRLRTGRVRTRRVRLSAAELALLRSVRGAA